MNPATVIALAAIAADATKAALAANQDSPSASTLAERLVGIGIGLVPVAELRSYLDAAEAKTIDASVDVAEEAKLAAKAINEGSI